MPFITFIYKMGDNNHTYYGKYCFDRMTDDHEGLDVQVKNILSQGLISMTNVRVGVLSFSNDNDIPTYSSEDEIKCFDYYYTYDRKIYVDGKWIDENGKKKKKNKNGKKNRKKNKNKNKYANIDFVDACGNKLDVIFEIKISKITIIRESADSYQIELTYCNTSYRGLLEKEYYSPDFISHIEKIIFHEAEDYDRAWVQMFHNGGNYCILEEFI